MKKGDLVHVPWSSYNAAGLWVETSMHPGIVIDYRPNVQGGTGVVTWRDRETERVGSEVIRTPQRGDVLVQMLDVDGVSWFDELHVMPISPSEPSA